MAKKLVKTFHPMAMAKSLEAQNEAIGLLFMIVHTAHNLAPKASEAQLRQLIVNINDKAVAARKLLWPEEE